MPPMHPMRAGRARCSELNKGDALNLLIVEDDTRLALALRKILEDAGHSVDAVHDGQMGVEYGLSGLYDVIVLDVMLPKKDGFAVTSELRRAHVDTPILLLTARGAVSDKIVGYDSGADDYMTKPFSPMELMAHLRALTRRRGDVLFEHLEVGDLTLDLERHALMRATKSISLSFKEFLVCKILMANAEHLVSKETLIAKAWGIDSSAGYNNVEAYISFLRKKLAHLGSSVRIETVRKTGYRLTASAVVDHERPEESGGDSDSMNGVDA